MKAISALFVFAHGFGFYHPELVCGLDQLHYIPSGAVPLIGILCVGIVSTSNRRILAVGMYSVRNVSNWVRGKRWGYAISIVLLLGALFGF